MQEEKNNQQQSSVFNLTLDLLDDWTDDYSNFMIHGLLVSFLAGGAEQSCWRPLSPSESAQDAAAYAKTTTTTAKNDVKVSSGQFEKQHQAFCQCNTEQKPVLRLCE